MAARKLPVEEPPNALIAAVQARECVLYAGAGLSAQAGFPIWRDFVSQLVGWATKSKRLERSIADSIGEAMESDLGLVADTIVSRSVTEMRVSGGLTIGEDSLPAIDPELHSFLNNVFIKRARTPPVLQRLKRLPFSAVLSTNFDTLLESTFENASVYTHRDGDALLGALSRGEFFILKLYGALSDPPTVLLSPSQYQAAVANNRLLARFMEALFVSRTLLFIGSSLEGITDYLGGIRFSGRSSREHYAVVDVSGNAWRVKQDVLARRYGITVLPYTASPGWPEMTRFVGRVVSRVETMAQPAAAHKGSPALLLKRIQLENIGPFERLDLELSDNWNVLLGDNGVGKSSILKAIGVVLAGQEAAPFASRLIRAGETKATIAIETAKRTYVVELFRSDADAEMSIHGSSPLSVEGWLAIGFPPLRSLTWNRSAQSGLVVTPRATAADLMPLVRGEFDPRLDALKEWLISVSDQIRSGAPEAKRMTLFRDKLFDVIGALTPGLRFEYENASSATREVTVQTDDGIVPLEAISQGTSSLVGWIGVALQRLFDVYADDPEPWMQPALILIDEVDAHMHPSWQQRLAKEFSKHFPNVQILATTHSPLIVGGMDVEDVHFLHRDPDGHVVVGRPETDLRGHRADQILTSAAFGLYSTVDPEVQEELDEYAELLIREDLSDEERKRLVKLAAKLREIIPSPEERAAAREAWSLMREWIEQRTRDQSLEEREEIVSEIQLRLRRIAGRGAR